ncbi:hypothetical protein MPSEU_000604400 [Mayamaea pseudoterrestris]|nr:hypothetical protein MPSEU_000604400 [Mayamaea pseudoterrestris]
MEINANTRVSVKKPMSAAAATPAKKMGGPSMAASNGKKPAAARRGSMAPPLKATITADEIKAYSQSPQNVLDVLFQQGVLGEPSSLHLGKPHAASTTRDRAIAAANLATLAKQVSLKFVLKECRIMQQMESILLSQGIEAALSFGCLDDESNNGTTNSLKPSTSALSLVSMDTVTTTGSIGTDSKRGKSTPANAREGCLLLLRALCQIVGRPIEPYVVGPFLASALDECASATGSVREAAEDASAAIVALASQWAYPSILHPLLLQALKSTEWRIKAAALERFEQCASTAPGPVHKLIPDLIPALANQVWDTKAQVSKAARGALLAVCGTNTNRDIEPTVPAVVNAICKPSDTNKAVGDLMGTTFVVPVDASTLAILCPVLARALKEKLAIHKRAACIVIANMSKLIEEPAAIAPFSSLLVPELKKVSLNVQFTEIRDEALKALASLTAALGDQYEEAEDATPVAEEIQAMADEVDAEQRRIKEEKEAEERKEEELKRKEAEERQRFKEAMDAQRQLDVLAANEAEQQRKDEEIKREGQKRSTKDPSGKSDGCKH